MQAQTAAAPKKPLLNNLLKLFMLAMVLANTASMMYITLLPLYLKELNADVLQVGLFFTISNVIPLMLQILGGWLSDNLGRLRSIAMGSVAGVISYVGLILAPTWHWVLIGEGLAAVTRSLVGPSFSSFIAEQSDEENRARVYGITETIFTVVTIVGPPLGGLLVALIGFKPMLMVAGSLYTVATLLRLYMARVASTTGNETERGDLSFSSLKTNLAAITALVIGGGLMTWIVVTDGVRDIAYTMAFTLESLYLEEIGGLTTTQIGLLMSIFGIANMLVNIPGGWLADKKGERWGISIGFFLHFVGIMTFLNYNSFLGYAISWATFGVGAGLMSPAYLSLTSKAVPEKLRGTAFGLVSTSLGLFSLPAPAIGAQLWQRVNPGFPFAIAAWVSLFIIVPIWAKFRLPPNGKTENLEGQPETASLPADAHLNATTSGD